MKYEYFSCGLDKNEGLNVGFCVQCKSFSFSPIISILILKKSKSKFLEYKNFGPIIVNLDQTLEHIEIKGLMDLGPNNLPRQFIRDDQLSMPVTHLVAKFEYISLFDIWVLQFDKLKWALNCAALMLWIYSIWHQLSYFTIFI